MALPHSSWTYVRQVNRSILVLLMILTGWSGGVRAECDFRTAAQAERRTIYVAPDGRDAWSGRLAIPRSDGSDGPLATLAAARDAARATAGPVRILARGGDYYLKAPILFDARDAGLSIMAAPGETPVFHGGPAVEGWAQSRGMWSAPLDVSANTQVGSLYISDHKQTKARFPNLPDGAGPRDGWLFAAKPRPEDGPSNDHFRFHAGDLPRLDEPKNLLVHIVGGLFPGTQWGSDVLPVVAIDQDTRTIRTQGTGYFFTGEGSRYFLEGARALLDSPGEWWHDEASRRLFYIADDTGFSGKDVVAGILATFIKLDGAHDMLISGLTFREGAPDGSGKYGTNMRGGGAVRLEHADRVRIIENRFEHVGVAIHVAESRDVVIAKNEISHIAGDAIYVGTIWGSFGRSDGAQIIGNRIADVGEVFFESSGVWFQATDRIRIAHNLVEGAAQFGIAGGSVWGKQDSSHHIVIESNIVRGANRQSADGGAIKLMGAQADPMEALVRANLVTDTDALMNRPGGSFWPARYENVREWPGPISWAIYLDGRASGVTIDGNLIENNVSGVGINGGWSNIVRDNVILGGSGSAFRIDDGTGRGWRPDWAQPNLIERNWVSVVRPDGQVVAVHAPGNSPDYARFKRNLYAGQPRARGFLIQPAVLGFGVSATLAELQLFGMEQDSLAVPGQITMSSDGMVRLPPGVTLAGGESAPAFPLSRIGPLGVNACTFAQ